MLPFFLLVSCAVIAGIIVALIYKKRERDEQHREDVTNFRAVVVQQLNKRGPGLLRLDQLADEYEVDDRVVDEVVDFLYTSVCAQAYADAVITGEERRYLDALRNALRIAPRDAERIETRTRNARYQQAATEALADGVITKEEETELARMRERFGLSERQAAALLGPEADAGYQQLFRDVIRDGIITPAELEQLKRYRSTFAISVDDANELTRKDALKLYRQWACNILQDGDITPEEEEGLRWLRREFGLPTEDTAKYDDQIVEAKQLAAYRRGELPTIDGGKILQRGETCHWETRCCFEWETATKTKNANGELVVTSHQILFTSPQKTFSFSPSKIIDVILYTNAVTLRTSISRGSGTYFIPRSKCVEAVLVGLVRRHKLLHLSSGFTSDRSRRIPQAVRQAVFLRDGGRCVQCGADYPIHYDHILPFSRGGSNTVENIQILCGPCNLRKSDSI